MRTFATGRQALAAPIFAVLTLVTAGTKPALAGAELRTCLMNLADRWLSGIAVSIAASEIDPATVDDTYVAREMESIVARCAETSQPDARVEAEFRAHMGRWTYHLDSKLQDITARGASD